MYASSGNMHFFTKSCHRQTYQNYEQSRQKLGTFLENKVCTLKIKVFKKFHLTVSNDNALQWWNLIALQEQGNTKINNGMMKRMKVSKFS